MKIQAYRNILASAAAAAGLLCCVSTQTAQAQNTTYWADMLYTHAGNDGGGGFNFNNGPVIPGTWDDFADFGDLEFSANFNAGIGLSTVAAYATWAANNPGQQYIYPFGPPPNTETYGETFIDPAGATTLNNYTFYISDLGDGANFGYQALVTDWSGSLVGGAGHAAPANILYASTVMNYVGNGSYEAVTVNIPGGGLNVTPGDAYFIGLTSLPGGAYLQPVGPSAPDAGSSMLLLTLSLGGITALRRRFSKV